MNAATFADYVHQVLFFGSPGELLTAAVPVLREGLTADDAVILNCRDEYNALLSDALGSDPRIACGRPANIYPRAATAAEALRRMVARRLAGGARRIRVVGEANFGTGPDGWAECGRYEAVADAVLSAFPVTTTCVYDARAVPEPVMPGLRSAHPLILTPAGRRIRNERYVDPATFLRLSMVGPDPVERSDPSAEFPALTDLYQVAALRHQLRRALDAGGVDGPISEDTVSAVHEVVVNGLVHGRPPVRVRLWTPPDRLVCTVVDAGPGFDDPLAGYVRTDPDRPYGPGAGLWLARQRCDRLETAATPSGFTVRLTTSTRGAGPAGHWDTDRVDGA